MRTLIVGCNLSGSLGAEAMVSAVIRQIKSDEPEGHVVLLALKEHDDESIAQELSLDVEVVDISLFELIFVLYFLFALDRVTFGRLRRFFTSRIIAEYRKADRVCDITGIAFTDKQSWMVQLKHYAWLIPSILAQKTECYVKLAQASGPFRRPINRILARSAFRSIHHFRARGNESLRNVLSLDPSFAKRDFKYAADLAFLMAPAPPDVAKNVLSHEIDSWNELVPYIGITPNLVIKNLSNSIEYRRLVNELALLSRYCNDLGRRILLIPHSCVIARNGHAKRRRLAIAKGYDDDVALCDTLVKQLGESPEVDVLRGRYRAHVVKAIFGLMEMNIVMRFHAMVASLGMQRPTLVIGWSHKYHEVMEQFDMHRFVVDSTAFTFCRHKELLDELLNSERIVQTLSRRETAVRQSALRNFDI